MPGRVAHDSWEWAKVPCALASERDALHDAMYNLKLPKGQAEARLLLKLQFCLTSSPTYPASLNLQPDAQIESISPINLLHKNPSLRLCFQGGQPKAALGPELA